MQVSVRTSRKIALAVLVVSALTSLSFALHFGSRMQYVDENEWSQLSASLYHNHLFSFDGIHSTTLRPPGFAWFLSVPQAFHGSTATLRIFNILALLSCQVLTYLISKNIGSVFVASVACLMTLLHPVFLYTAALLFPQTLGAALLLWAVWMMTDMRPFTKLRMFSAGMACSLLTLTIPAFFPLLLVLSLWLVWRRSDFRRLFLVFLVAPLVLIGGWSLRNYAVVKSPIFVASNGGINFLLAYSENSTVNSGSYTNIDRYTRLGFPMSSGEADKFYRKSAVEWITDHPSEALHLFSRRLLWSFSFIDGETADKAPASLSLKIIMFVTYEPLLLLLLTRLMLAFKFPLSEAEICLIGLYLLNALFSSLFFPRIRFRLPVDWLLIIIGTQTLRVIAQQIVPGRLRSLDVLIQGGPDTSERSRLT
jgi:hypothetical protein